MYARECGECHGAGLDGAEAPPLRGVDFLNGWAGRTTDELFAYVRDEMPPGLGRSLGDRVYLSLVAYLLDMNGARPGGAPLAVDAAVMIGDAADVAEARRAAREGDRAAAAADAVRQPGGAARAGPGHRRAARGFRRRATG